MTIVEFFTARLDEDAAQLAQLRGGWFDTSRFERDIAAKRKILDLHRQLAGAERQDVVGLGATALEDAIRFLCETFADHPDYDPAWRR